MNKLLIILCLPLSLFGQSIGNADTERWHNHSKNTTIIRDNWGVPHIYGKSDANAVFGIMYAQCEDNYWQMEETTIRLLGRSAEVYGEKDLQADATIALFQCVQQGKQTYSTADAELKKLCDAAADGINYYLFKHPAVPRRLLQHYEPWFFLVPTPVSPSSHGITQSEIRKVFYGSFLPQPTEGLNDYIQRKESGSNTIALGPSKTTSGKPMIVINPHVGFFGDGQRYEAQMVSREGLNVSGFAIFGTFYIWSGFNHYAGWAHTNTASDFEDVYLEHFNHLSDSTQYRYNNGYRKAVFWKDTLKYKTVNGFGQKVYEFRKTHHGPVTAKRDSLWVSIRNASNRTDLYITQSWQMCKAKNLAEFTAAMSKLALTTNTMYADRFGNIVYWHGNAIPKRKRDYNWRLPVDGSSAETEWSGEHPLSEIIQVKNPATGWIQNSNSTPFEAAGASSPIPENYAPYMSYEEQNFRSEESIRQLSGTDKISFDGLQKIITSTHLPMMADWLPQIIAAYQRELVKQPGLQIKLGTVIDTLQNWDYRYAVSSKATTLAVFWYFEYMQWARSQVVDFTYGAYTSNREAGKKLPAPDSIAIRALANATDTLVQEFGTPFIAWGDINRLQRNHTSGREHFDDNKPSLPVAAVHSGLGSLFAFWPRSEPGLKKMYGVGGNTYTSVISFGKKIKAKSIVNFGQSADPLSPHYFDQAARYAKGEFKDAYFYKSAVRKHTERKYHPGN